QALPEPFGMAGKALPAPSVERAVVQAVSPAVHMVSNVSLETTEPKKRTQPEERTFSGNELTGVGDSSIVASRRLLKSRLPGNDLPAKMGWQPADVIRQLQTLKDSQALRAV